MTKHISSFFGIFGGGAPFGIGDSGGSAPKAAPAAAPLAAAPAVDAAKAGADQATAGIAQSNAGARSSLLVSGGGGAGGAVKSPGLAPSGPTGPLSQYPSIFAKYLGE